MRSAKVVPRGCSRPSQRTITDFAADQPFAQARLKLLEHYGFAIGESTIQRIALGHAQALFEAGPTNFLLRRFDLVLGPALQRRPPQQPHFLNNPLFHRVGLLEISLVVRYSKGYRYDSLAKTRVRLKKCQKRLVAEFRRRHFAKSPSIRESPAYAASL